MTISSSQERSSYSIAESAHRAMTVGEVMERAMEGAKTRKHMIALGFAAAFTLSPSYQAMAASPSSIDQDAEQKNLVDRLTLDRATTLAAAQRRADERERTLLAQLDQRDKQLRRALADTKRLSTEAEKDRAELRKVTDERQRLVRDIESRDSPFKAELAEYRRLVAALAATPSPERRKALERYADGDRIAAFPVLEELTRAEEAARDKASKLKAAEQYRQLAALANDMRDRGEKTTSDVLQLLGKAAQRDPKDFWTWVYLARLNRDAGKLQRSLAAARSAKTVANNPREAIIAMVEYGEVQQEAGDLDGARQSFQESIRILRDTTASARTSLMMRRDLVVSLWKLGAVQLEERDAQGALKTF